MTREMALLAMNGATLIGVADKLGLKVSCNRTRTALKEAKSKVIERILAAEAPQQETTEKSEPQEVQKTWEAPELAPIEAEPEEAAPEEPAPEESAPEKPKVKSEKKRKFHKHADHVDEVEVPDITELPGHDIHAETVEEIADLYDKLNDVYFDGLLPKPEITIREAKKTYDPCCVKKTDDNYTVQINRAWLNDDAPAAIMHAMIHIFCAETGIADTCQSGRYHNYRFRAECRARDIAVIYDTPNGYAHTMTTTWLIEKVWGKEAE